MGRSGRRKPPDRQVRFIRASGNHLPDGRTDNFVRLYASLVESNAYMSLSGTAAKVFNYIALQCGREDPGKLRCCWPESQYTKYGLTKRQVIRATKELEEAGFLEIDRYRSRIPNVYKLSDQWKNKTQ